VQANEDPETLQGLPTEWTDTDNDMPSLTGSDIQVIEGTVATSTENAAIVEAMLKKPGDPSENGSPENMYSIPGTDASVERWSIL
jgi:hypothetical protein